jgi:hypothetical protein
LKKLATAKIKLLTLYTLISAVNNKKSQAQKKAVPIYDWNGFFISGYKAEKPCMDCPTFISYLNDA